MNFVKFGALYERILEDYKKNGNIIIAYDIDDTVRPYRNSKESCDLVVDLLKRANEVLNASFIVFTSNKNINKVESFLNTVGLPYDKINEDMDWVKERDITDGKIYYNLFLDDKAGLAESYDALNSLVLWVESLNGR